MWKYLVLGAIIIVNLMLLQPEAIVIAQSSEASQQQENINNNQPDCQTQTTDGSCESTSSDSTELSSFAVNYAASNNQYNFAAMKDFDEEVYGEEN